MDRNTETDFEAFVLAEGSRLLRTAFLIVGDRSHAEDLVQLTLERLARRWTRLDGDPAAYARRVLLNACRDRWRRLRARVVETDDNAPGPSAPDVAGAVALQRSLIAALNRLSPRQRTMLVLRYFDDLSEQEVAETLSISVGTVKSTVSRALVRLRAVAPELAEEPL